MFEADQPTPIQKIETKFLEGYGITLSIKRDDLIHTDISGNKWRKLKYNFLEAKKQNLNTILTFGGAYSNHIAATAAAANKYGFNCIGVIRGDELNSNSNETLKKAHEHGMKLCFISRANYRNRSEESFSNSLKEEFENCFIIPEGGSNTLAIKGCTEIVDEIDQEFDTIISAVGSGGTLAGLACGLNPNQQALGICVLKGANYLDESVNTLINEFSNDKRTNWKINHDHHLGGYTKYNDLLIEFINEFKLDNGIQLDPVYTGKLMLAIYTLIKEGYFEFGTKIVALHTGGLQGIKGFNTSNNTRINI
jgi:1-aminocyclopropane-1-carboxylate deaminase